MSETLLDGDFDGSLAGEFSFFLERSMFGRLNFLDSFLNRLRFLNLFLDIFIFKFFIFCNNLIIDYFLLLGLIIFIYLTVTAGTFFKDRLLTLNRLLLVRNQVHKLVLVSCWFALIFHFGSFLRWARGGLRLRLRNRRHSRRYGHIILVVLGRRVEGLRRQEVLAGQLIGESMNWLRKIVADPILSRKSK